MKGNSQEIIGLRQAAKRVKEFFSNKPLKQHCEAPEFSQKYLKELIASHHYLLIKSMAALKLMTPFSTPSQRAPQKKIESSSEPVPVTNEQQFSDRIDGTAYGEGGLSQGRVHGWRLKEFFLAKNQLQSLRQSFSHTKPHEIFPLLDGDSNDTLSQTQEWQNQLSSKEERQFQITRITKILSS